MRSVVREEVQQALAGAPPASPWLDAAGAAAYLAMTEEALRSLVKRRELPVHRLPNRRLRFRPEELDAWARGDA